LWEHLPQACRNNWILGHLTASSPPPQSPSAL
jgi:hypothetical protein